MKKYILIILLLLLIPIKVNAQTWTGYPPSPDSVDDKKLPYQVILDMGGVPCLIALDKKIYLDINENLVSNLGTEISYRFVLDNGKWKQVWQGSQIRFTFRTDIYPIVKSNCDIYKDSTYTGVSYYKNQISQMDDADTEIIMFQPANKEIRSGKISYCFKYNFKIPYGGNDSEIENLEQRFKVYGTDNDIQSNINKLCTVKGEDLINNKGYVRGVLTIYPYFAIDNELTKNISIGLYDGIDVVKYVTDTIIVYRGFVDANADGKDDRDGLTPEQIVNPVNDQNGDGIVDDAWQKHDDYKPDRIDYKEGFVGDIQYGFDTLIWFLKTPFIMVGQAISVLVNSMINSFEFMQPVNDLIGNVFGGFPPEIKTLIVLSFSISTLALFYRLFRGV